MKTIQGATKKIERALVGVGDQEGIIGLKIQAVINIVGAALVALKDNIPQDYRNEIMALETVIDLVDDVEENIQQLKGK